MLQRQHMQSHSILVKLKRICVEIKCKGHYKILIVVYLGGRSVPKSLFSCVVIWIFLKLLLITLLGWKKSWLGWEVWVVRINGIAPTSHLPHLGRLGLEVLFCSFSRAYMSSIALQKKIQNWAFTVNSAKVFFLFPLLFSLEWQKLPKSIILQSPFAFFKCTYTYIFLFLSFPHFSEDGFWTCDCNSIICDTHIYI